MAAEELSQEELDYNAFAVVFYPALERVSLPAEAASEQNGHYNTAWETHSELTGHAYLVNSAALSFTEIQKEALINFLNEIAGLPKEAISPAGVNTRTVEGDITSLNHPAWAPLRPHAKKLTAMLAPVVDRSHAYFKQPQA